MRFNLGITGKGKLPAELYTKEGQHLLAELCKGPVARHKVADHLLIPFETVGALRPEGDNCYLNFPCFLQKDQEHLHVVCEQLGKSLATKIQNETMGLTLDFKYGDVAIDKYLFFLVGCVSLDWYGLLILKDLGLIYDHREQKRGRYGDFTLYGNEAAVDNLKELYWGSHNFKLGKYYFTSFGDHEHRRTAFPDLLFKGCSPQELQNLFAKDKVKQKMMHSLFWRRLLFSCCMLRVGRMITKGALPAGKIAHLLDVLLYTKDNKFNVPVIIKDDMVGLNEFIDKTKSIIRAWISANSPGWPEDFKDLTPLRQGVDFKEVLIQIWHYVFGHANK